MLYDLQQFYYSLAEKAKTHQNQIHALLEQLYQAIKCSLLQKKTFDSALLILNFFDLAAKRNKFFDSNRQIYILLNEEFLGGMNDFERTTLIFALFEKYKLGKRTNLEDYLEVMKIVMLQTNLKTLSVQKILFLFDTLENLEFSTLKRQQKGPVLLELFELLMHKLEKTLLEQPRIRERVENWTRILRYCDVELLEKENIDQKMRVLK